MKNLNSKSSGATDPTSMQALFKDEPFQKSSACPGVHFKCVEVAKKGGHVAIRNSADPARNTVFFNKEEWAAFLDGAKAGEFDV